MKLLITSLFIATSAVGAVPLRWTVETSRVQPVTFDVVRGETITLEATLQNYGKPLAMDGKAVSLFYQTNGMNNVWWTAPASVSSNRLTATFTPTMDPGGATVSGFIGTTGEIYRAAWTLRFRKGPGATPNAIALPTPTLDFADTVVINAPWLTAVAADAKYALINDVPTAYRHDAANQAISILIDWAFSGDSLGNSNHRTFYHAVANWMDGGFYEWLDDGGGDVWVDRLDNRYASLEDYNNHINDAAQNYATKAALATTETKANQALLYAHGTYQYMTGNKNAWFSGTNYVTVADGTTRTRFVWEEGMDTGTVPCSMALWEIRNNETNVVWDARDWTVWYWNFKSAQMSNALASATHDLAVDVRDNYMRRGFAKYTAVNGLDNPDPNTLWIDTKTIQLAAGHQWQRLVEVGGSGYWTITGNGIEVGSPSATNSFLTISDFEGKAAFTFRKTDAYQVYAKKGDITSQYRDAQGRVVFTVVASQEPTAEFSTVLDTSTFVEQDAEGCPADYEWTVSETPGAYDCHFLLKPGITSNACFARFKITVEGENIIENAVPMKMTGGIVVEQDGVKYKIRPKVSGSTVTWEVVQ